MATIKEIAEIVGVSSAAVSRVLNYDEGISVSEETREAIFATAEKIGYKKKVIYPKIENVALLYFTDNEDELEDVFYRGVREEVIKQAKKMNIRLQIYDRRDGMSVIPRDLNAFIAVGWLTRKEINQLYKISPRGVFIGTSPDEKLFDAVRPNMDSFVTQMVDYFVEKGHKKIGFIGGSDRNIDTGKPSMDIREWSFRQSVAYYHCLEEEYILISEKFTVDEGYRMGKELLKKQISSSVRWQQSVERMIADGVEAFIEIGPKKSVCGFMKRIDKTVPAYHVDKVTDLESVLEVI